MQHWFKDLEDTLSFAERRIAPKSVGIDALTHIELSKAITQNVKPKDEFFEREEIRQRMADFKATQRRFEIEREEFFKKTMASLRANSF
jgi:predicted RNA-binding protein with RPS1 domain